ncbi:MAG: hypothetical protein A2Y15_07260 [Clostridiales bacterium GWF2_36_10]|nr:MAG: hypothetical protein A2Y15_07260 [Clostridiales bacterium GWF2_36_10]HAN21316.1 RIP metalloprotease RseP [Clostridiales bacterium]
MSGILSSISTILITVFIFGLLIFIHELGHYIAARRCGVGIIEFAIGMGPKIISWEGKVNTFSIRAFPIGGFVSMVGEYSDEIEEKDKGKVPLDQKPVWQRAIIALSGPVMNLALGFVIMSLLVITGDNIYTTTVSKFNEGATSSQNGLMIDDEIIEINGKNVYVFTDMYYKIATDGIEPLDITVLRDGEKVQLYNVQFPTENNKGVNFGTLDFKINSEKKTVGNVLYQSFYQSISSVYMTIDQLADVIKGRYGVDAISGPVGIGNEIGNVIEQGIKSDEVTFGDTVRTLSTYLVLITISLGIFNLLPIPVLDGGMLLFCLIEAIRKKPINKKVERSISAVFMVLLLTATVLIFFKDFISLF